MSGLVIRPNFSFMGVLADIGTVSPDPVILMILLEESVVHVIW